MPSFPLAVAHAAPAASIASCLKPKCRGHGPLSRAVGHVRVLFDRIIRVEQVIDDLIRKISLANESSLTKQRATALVFDGMLCGVFWFLNSLADPLTLVYPHLLEPLVGPELFIPNI